MRKPKLPENKKRMSITIKLPPEIVKKLRAIRETTNEEYIYYTEFIEIAIRKKLKEYD